MGQSVYFNGETLTIPGAYSAIDVSNMGTKGDNAGAKIMAIIGECDGGEPASVQFFSDPVAARKVLKSGELLKACEKAWNPVSASKEGVKLGGANIIACIRANKATKSSYNLMKTADAAKPQIVFESKDWGANTAHQVKIGDGTLPRTKKMIVYDQTTGIYETYDNVGNLFTLNYTGNEAYAELNVYLDGNNSMYLQTKIGADEEHAVEDIKVQLNNTTFKSIKALIQYLQAYDNYVVSATNKYNTKLKVTDIDLVTKANIKLASGGTAYRVTAVYSDLAAVLDVNSQLISVKEMDKSQGDINNFDYVTLAGGTKGITPASWVEYFDMLSNFDIFYIVPLTSDVSIHAELVSHLTNMSGNLGRERRAVIGGDISETVKQTIQRARDISDSRVQVVHGGFYDYNSAGELELYPPYILAAAHAGRAAFLDDGESATRDVYRMVSPEYKLEKNEVEQLLAAGCLAFEFVLGKNSISNSYVRLVQDLTTDTTSTDTVHTERATGALADSINKELREELDSLLTGKRTTLSDLTSAKNRVLTVLFNRQKKGHIVDYKDVFVTKTGTVTTVDYWIAPAEPNNFTLITGHYYSQELSV